MKTKTKETLLKTTLRKYVLLAFVLVCSAASHAQEWDFGTWQKVKVGGELTKNFELALTHQLRLENNSRSVDQFFSQLELEYDLPKGLEVGAAYRLSWAPNKDGSYANKHRYNIDLSYSKTFGTVKAKLRSRFQHKPSASLFNDRLKPESSPMHVRLKLSISYRGFKKWTPGAEYEVYFRTNIDKHGIGKMRYRIFLDYDLPKRQEIGVFYMLQTNHTGSQPRFDSIVGLSYNFEWKRPKKKAKNTDK